MAGRNLNQFGSKEPEVGKKLEIFFPGAGSAGSLQWQFDHLQFDSADSWIALYSDQVSQWLSPSSTKSPLKKSLLSPPILVIPSLFLVQVGWFFHWQYLYFIIFQFSSLVPLIGWESFYRLIPCPIFLLSLLIIGLGGFPPMTWLFRLISFLM